MDVNFKLALVDGSGAVVDKIDLSDFIFEEQESICFEDLYLSGTSGELGNAVITMLDWALNGKYTGP